MKQIVTLIFASIMLLACGNTKYRITGTIENAHEGDSVVLGYSNNGQDFITTNKSVIKDGQFLFEGNQDGCKIYYIGYEGESTPIYALFFLEAGDIKADISTTGSHITGSPMNDLNIALEDSLGNYVMQMMSYQDTLYSDTTLTDEKKTELSNKSFIVQREAMTFIQNTIRENINNMVGLFLLVQYCDLFDNAELAELITSIPDENKDRSNNALYDILLEIQEERTSSDSIEDIINAIEEDGEDFEMQEDDDSDIVE